MMWWMIGFWVVCFLALILLLVNFRYKNQYLGFVIGLLFTYSILLFLMAIITKDPLFEAIGLPVGYEWLGGIGVIGFTAWSLYLNPLKKRVIECEKDIKVIRNDVKHIFERLTEFRDALGDFRNTLDEFRPYIVKRR